MCCENLKMWVAQTITIVLFPDCFLDLHQPFGLCEDQSAFLISFITWGWRLMAWLMASMMARWKPRRISS